VPRKIPSTDNPKDEVVKISQVAVTLYTVHEYCKNASDLAATVRKIRKMGYPAVQLSQVGPIPPEEILKIVTGEGLTICATHESGELLFNEPERVVDKLRTLGCRLTAYPFPKGIDFKDAESIRDFARKLDKAGATLRKAGITLAYHNHDIEFLRFEDTTVLEYIYSHTDPSNLAGEIDTYWIQHGGGDCVEWCRKLRNRLPLLHIKDYSITIDRQAIDCDIGRGTLPFGRIIDEAEQSGCRWFIVERDTSRDPFESLATSFNYIKAHLAA
jgi:sugar phosphate isomerase/epimerase